MSGKKAITQSQELRAPKEETENKSKNTHIAFPTALINQSQVCLLHLTSFKQESAV